MIKFYGYKRCSTSKKARKWFDDHDLAYDYQDLVEQPPTKDELKQWISAHQDRGLRYFFNTSGMHYREQNIKEKIPTMTIDEASDLLSQDGKLIKRPLVVDGDKLTCGFKPDIYEEVWQKK